MTSQEAFTAGIEHGGLTTSYEVRVLVCWLLDKVQQDVSMATINEALQLDSLVNYFELAHAVSDLLSTGHIKECEKTDDGVPLQLTELGHKTAVTLEHIIPYSVREKSFAALKFILRRKRMENENDVKIEETSDGWRLTFRISDVSSDLMNLTLYAPTQELCIAMRDKFFDAPDRLYQMIFDYLIGTQR